MRFRLGDFGDRRAAGPPDWPVSAGRPRILVEAADGAVLGAMQRILRAAGYEVAGCGGPEALRGGACPLVEEGRCSTAERADVILNCLGLNTARSRAVLAALRARLPGTSLVVEVPRPQVACHRDELAGCRIALWPMTPAGLREQVHAAAAGSAH